MRCYLVSAVVTTEIPDEGKKTRRASQYGATQAAARKIRDEFVGRYDLKKKDVEVEEAEIPMAKAALLEFINGLMPK